MGWVHMDKVTRSQLALTRISRYKEKLNEKAFQSSTHWNQFVKLTRYTRQFYLRSWRGGLWQRSGFRRILFNFISLFSHSPAFCLRYKHFITATNLLPQTLPTPPLLPVQSSSQKEKDTGYLKRMITIISAVGTKMETDKAWMLVDRIETFFPE